MRKVSTLVGLTLFALAGMARAQEEAPAPEAAAPAAGEEAAAPAAAPEESMAPAPEAAPVMASGSDYVSRGLTQTAGNLQVTVPIVISLSKDLVLKPVEIPLDVRYGVTDQLEVFLAHSSPVGFPIAGGGGLCLTGKEKGCPKVYDNLAIGGQFSLLKDAGLELAALAAFNVLSLDAGYYAANVGVNFKYATGPIAIKAAPIVQIGVNKRDFNKEHIALPVQVAFQAVPDQLALFLDTGIGGPFDGFGDSWVVPVGVGASFQAMPNLDVGGEFMLPSVATGASGNKAFDSRTLAVFAQYRLN
jgi:hypothetical protein